MGWTVSDGKATGLRLTLLGEFAVTWESSRLRLDRCTQRLTAFLALRNCWVPRSVTAVALWPDADPDQGRAALRSALARLRRVDAPPLLEEARRHERLGSLVQKAAAEVNRNDLGLIRDLGDACAAVGRIPEARAWYNLAVSRDPLDTRSQQGLARLREAGGPSSSR